MLMLYHHSYGYQTYCVLSTNKPNEQKKKDDTRVREKNYHTEHRLRLTTTKKMKPLANDCDNPEKEKH